MTLGRIDEAAACFTSAGTARDEVGDDAGAVLSTYGQAVLAADRGDHAAARPLFVRARDGFQQLQVATATGMALAGIAASDEYLGDTGSAASGYQQLLRLGETSGEMGLTAAALEGLARAALTDHDPARAAELLTKATVIRREYDRPAAPTEAALKAVTAAAVDRALTGRADRSH